MPQTALRTPLHEQHLASGGRMVEFAGYELPVQYQGIIAEARAVRESVGIFDVSHMARLRFSGERAGEFIEWVTTNDFGSLMPRQGQYSLLPNEIGGVVDDIIVHRLAPDLASMVVNASNHAKDVSWLSRQNRFGVSLEDHTHQTVMLAVQGPRATELLASNSADGAALRNAPLFGFVATQVGGVEVQASRSGYTGEDGFELVCQAEEGPKLWERLTSEGATPCGLGSRDVLRVEAGLPLYGHELSDEISPIEAGLGWVVAEGKQFIGAEHVARAREEGPKRKLHGFRMESRRIPSPGATVTVDGRTVGEVTSGVFSPLLERGIGFAFIESGIELKTPCEIELRGGAFEPAMIVGKRFFKRPRN